MIEIDVFPPFFRNIVFVEDGLDGTFRYTRPAVDAFIRVDEDHRLTFVEAVYGAHDHAIRILTSKTRLGHDHRHGSFPHNAVEGSREVNAIRNA